eukprot:3935545-Rhodomonas_salina.11
MSVVHSKSFVPKEKHLGSWDPTSSQWLQNDYTFTAQLWYGPLLFSLTLLAALSVAFWNHARGNRDTCEASTAALTL